MKIWKIVMCLLAVLLLAGCVSGATINSIDLKVTAPATGMTKTSATTTTSGISIYSTLWTPAIDSSKMFDANQAYTVTITVKNTTGNTFASSGTVKVNGVEKSWNPSGGTLTVSHTFPATATASPVSDIKCELEEPKASNTPAKSVDFTNQAGKLKSTVTWDTKDTKFVLGKKYTATVVIEPTNEKAYPITSPVTLKCNGDSIKDFKLDGQKITFTYAFGETQPKGTADILSFTVNAPVAGQNPSSYVRINAHTDKITATLAWDTTSAFKPDVPYTATVTVYAKDGYVIKEGAAAKINGETAILNMISNTKATVTYTFDEIDSVASVNVNFAAPATGNLAQTAATEVKTMPADAAKTATISWSPALVNGEFDSGIEYNATVTIPISDTGIVFDNDTAVYINGEKAATSVSKDYKTLTATYTFPKTTFIPNPIEIIKEMFNLMLAIFNPASYFF